MRLLRLVTVLAAMGLVVWVRLLPQSLEGVTEEARRQLTYTAGGRDHAYLGGHDGYEWLRLARNVLRHGTPCDGDAGAECRDERTLAPVGASIEYRHSPHLWAIALLHRLVTFLDPDRPLAASAFLVAVIVAALGVVPAFAIGRRLGGDLGGLAAAVVTALNPLFLLRSTTGDNDVWNVVLPLFMVWGALGAATAASVTRQAIHLSVVLFAAGFHAFLWRGWVFPYAVVLGGLALHAVVVALRGLLGPAAGERRDAEIGRAVLAPLLLVAIPAPLALLSGRAAQLAREIPTRLAAFTAERAGAWPDPFATVDELARPDLRQIAAMMGGAPYLFAGWLGLLLLCMPRRGWRPWNFAVLIAGNYLYWYLLAGAGFGRPLLLVLLALPLAAALARGVTEKDAVQEGGSGPAIVIVVWFLAALFLAFEGLRFVLLMVPPFGIAFGVAVGRFQEWLARLADRLPAPQSKAARLVALLAGLAALVGPVRQGWATARSYVPRVHDAWWDALERIRNETAPETIVATWWPYGYWAKYAAERRVSADGGSLPTHVPLWLGRLLLASDEAETAGLLRMLACGSDATPQAGNERGACKRLSSRGVDVAAAHELLIEMAPLDRDRAAAVLGRAGVHENAWSEILEASHCRPPPLLLVLSSEMIRTSGWKILADWNRSLPAHEGYLGGGWIACAPRASAQERVCPLGGVPLRRIGVVLEAFTYATDAPAAGRLRWRRVARDSAPEARPAEILIAGNDGLESVRPDEAIDAEVAVLIDPSNDRILVGAPALLRSTFTHLMLLDGRYTRRFSKWDDRTGYRGERVVTWEVDSGFGG